MNICFLTQREVVPTIGGTERISSTLAHGLTERYGCQCYNLYNIPSDGLHEAFHSGMRFDTAEPLMLDKVEAKIREWGIDVLIHQDLFPELAVPLARMMHSLGKKYVYCVHFAPCYHRESFCLKALLQFCAAHRSLRNFLKLPLYPYLKAKDRQRLSGLYRGICDGADRIVLLSERYIPEFRQLYGIKETARLCAVNNSLSFSEFITPPLIAGEGTRRAHRLPHGRKDEAHLPRLAHLDGDREEERPCPMAAHGRGRWRGLAPVQGLCG